MTSKTVVGATINGERVEFLCRPHQSLLECLRDILGLTGAKEGCNDGNCGACSVLLDLPADLRVRARKELAAPASVLGRAGFQALGLTDVERLAVLDEEIYARYVGGGTCGGDDG